MIVYRCSECGGKVDCSMHISYNPLLSNNLLFTEFECENCGLQKATDSDMEVVIDMKPERKEQNND